MPTIRQSAEAFAGQAEIFADGHGEGVTAAREQGRGDGGRAVGRVGVDGGRAVAGQGGEKGCGVAAAM